MKKFWFWLTLFRDFAFNVWGIIDSPYSSFRKIVKADPYQLIVIFLTVAAYFFLVSPIKLRTLHPFILTLNTSRLFTTCLFSYLLICFTLTALARILGSQESLKSVLMGWGYSLIPTLLWFLATSLIFVILPPPRHATILGNLFSIVFIAFSISLFFWKGLLYYLTLRLGLKLDLKKIIMVSIIFLPSLFLYSIWLYRLGIFKVPFV